MAVVGFFSKAYFHVGFYFPPTIEVNILHLLKQLFLSINTFQMLITILEYNRMHISVKE